MKNYLTEIETALAVHPRRTSAHHPESYIGGGQSKLRYLGLRVPHLRQTRKIGFSFSQREPAEVAKIWDYVWRNSDCFEVMSLALGWFEDRSQEKILADHWPTLKKWSARIDNWAHADSLASIYARLLERSPDSIYPTLLEWNQSANPWRRRLSIVSLLYYSSQRKKVLPFRKIIDLVHRQIDYDHHYVQKGVGWALREAGNVYPRETGAYLEKNIARLSPSAFSAATEKLAKPQKERLKKMRKAGRLLPDKQF